MAQPPKQQRVQLAGRLTDRPLQTRVAVQGERLCDPPVGFDADTLKFPHKRVFRRCRGACWVGTGKLGFGEACRSKNPPLGRFITIDGTKLHYLERGSGPALVLLHGNGTMLQDFVASGLIDRLAKDYRVIAFDRPGFGYSERPSGIVWDPDAQAGLIQSTLRELGVSEAIVLGHSWGTLVGLALATNYPAQVRALIVISGYYFPTPRLDAALAAISAMPGIGAVITHTIAPLVS